MYQARERVRAWRKIADDAEFASALDLAMSIAYVAGRRANLPKPHIRELLQRRTENDVQQTPEL